MNTWELDEVIKWIAENNALIQAWVHNGGAQDPVTSAAIQLIDVFQTWTKHQQDKDISRSLVLAHAWFIRKLAQVTL